MAVARRADGVYGDADLAGGAVLEPYRHGQARGQLPVYLAFHRAGANGTETHQVGVVLAEGGIQELAGGGQAQFGHVQQHLARQVQATVDVETAVQVGVVDQPFPAHHRARLLEIHPQYRQDGVLQGFAQFAKAAGKLQQCLGVVDRAGADNGQYPGIPVAEDGFYVAAGSADLRGQGVGQRQFLRQHPGRDQRAGIADADVIGAAGHGQPRSPRIRLRNQSARVSCL